MASSRHTCQHLLLWYPPGSEHSVLHAGSLSHPCAQGQQQTKNSPKAQIQSTSLDKTLIVNLGLISGLPDQEFSECHCLDLGSF